MAILCCKQMVAIDFTFRHITSEQGLPHQQVEALCQDKDGNIWMGTRNGLACYDGYNTKTYYHDDSDEHSLAHNFVRHLFLDKQGNIWVLTENGICRYQPTTDNFKCYQNPGYASSMVQTSKGTILCGGDHIYVYDADKDKFSVYPSVGQGAIVSMAIDSHDNIFVATNSTIFRYDASLTNITNPYSSLLSDFLTGADAIVPMIFDAKGCLWVGRNGKGVMRIWPNGKSIIYEGSQISNGIVRVIKEDQEHNIWLGTEKGLTEIDANGEIKIFRSSFSDESQLSDNAIYSIISDKHDNIWIGSYFGGVDILLRSSNLFKSFKPGLEQGEIHGKVARGIVETSPGIFWIATEDGGLNIYNSSTSVFTLFKGIPQLGTNVHSLWFDKNSNTLWIGTFRNGLFKYNISTGSSKRYINSGEKDISSVFGITRQKNGRLWIATTQGLYYYDEGKDEFHPVNNNIVGNTFIYTLKVDAHDNLWAGTVGNGLFMLNGKNGKVLSWRHTSPKSQLSDNYITCIYEDKKGTIWFGTNNNGIQYFDAQRKNIHTLENAIFPQKSCVCSINGDGNGNIWISTSQGLYRYIVSNNTMIRFSTENGLPTNQFNFASSILAQNGDMLFGTVKGLVSFSPQTIHENKSALTVHLRNLVINNAVVNANTEGSPLKTCIDLCDEIKLSYSQAKSFSIEYGVIEPGANASIEYQIRLEGIDKNWRDMGTERKFSGYNLAPGTYTLQIRANNSNSNWDDCPVKSIKIIVKPPFYQSIWAYLFYVLLLGIIAYITSRILTSRMHEREAVRIAQMEKEQLAQLDQAKFDFFTSVSHELKTPLSLIIAPLKVLAKQNLNAESKQNLDLAIKNTKKMEGLINELVTYNKIETDKFPFYVQKGNPLEFIRLNVLAFRELTAEKGLQLSIDCENNGEDVWFSPSYVERILNNLLSNAIKFTPQGGSVKVKAAIVNDDSDKFTYLKFSVADTGIGIAPEERENIWGRYYQTKRGYNVNNSGWGIGLSLVKRLADVHKGNISLESELGKGSTFTVMLNVSANAFTPSSYISDDKVLVPITEYKFAQSMADLSIDSSNGEDVKEIEEGKMTLLIVDDNKDLLSFLSSYFSREYNILTATNGQEALEIAHKEDIQLVVSDVMMPEMDGIELCKSLKENMETSHIPVILLTAKSEPDDVVEGYKSGAESYVSKPFEPEILELQIKNIISLQKTRQVEIANSQELDVSTSTLTTLDKKFIKDINELVDQNISNSDLSISTITEELGISRSLLHTKMRSLMDMSMGDFIRKKRLDKACILLKETHSVAESAYKTGFSDPNYFSKVFKKYIGVSPTEYIASPK